MANILIVCTANICRSPVVEYILRDRLQKAGHADWQVSSAGTWVQRTRGASRNSVDVVREWEGLDLSPHQARGVSDDVLAGQSLILCMESGHAEALRIEFPGHAANVFLLSQMVNNRRFNISDPYGQPRPQYEIMVRDVRQLIDDGLQNIIRLAQGE